MIYHGTLMVACIVILMFFHWFCFVSYFGEPKIKVNVYIAGPICSIVVNKWSIRISIIFGGALTSIGLVMSSFATGIYFLIFSFGLLTGKSLNK